MKISTRGRYALRLMMDIALAESDAPVRVKDIAKRQELSEKYLEQIVSVLNKAGHVIGIVQIRKYLKAYLQFKENVQLQRVMDRPYFVKLGTPIDEQLAGMSASKTHIAIVRDENENAVGILTVEDILEELVGEIYDEDDKVDKGGETNA